MYRPTSQGTPAREAQAGEDRGDKAESRDPFGQPLRAAVARL